MLGEAERNDFSGSFPVLWSVSSSICNYLVSHRLGLPVENVLRLDDTMQPGLGSQKQEFGFIHLAR